MGNWDRIAEKKIRDAMAEGKFDGLGRNQAIDLEEYFKLPEEIRMAYSVLKSAGCVPEEVELLKEVDRIKNEMAHAPDAASREKCRTALSDAELRLRLALERKRT